MPTLTPELIHPLMVHFPIAGMLALVVLDHIVLFSGRNLGVRGCMASLSALLAVLVGISAFIVYVNGTMAYAAALTNGTAPDVMGMHRDLGTAFTVLALLWALVRGGLWARPHRLNHMWSILLVSFELGLAVLVVITALYGMGLVYLHGVNVAAMASGS